MILSQDLGRLQDRLGHVFARPQLLIEALTHPSLGDAARPDNQRLEFLGDRVLGLVIAEALSRADPDASEGLLAPRFNALVRKETCAEVAQEIALGDVLRLGRSEMLSGGQRKQALLADAIEAVIAAVYLDAGFEAARDAVIRLWGGRINLVEDDARDPKTALQEWAQAKGLGLPDYCEIGREGPDHAPIFHVSVSIPTGQIADARAATKRKAEQAAAHSLLSQLEAPN